MLQFGEALVECCCLLVKLLLQRFLRLLESGCDVLVFAQLLLELVIGLLKLSELSGQVTPGFVVFLVQHGGFGRLLAQACVFTQDNCRRQGRPEDAHPNGQKPDLPRLGGSHGLHDYCVATHEEEHDQNDRA